MELVSRKRLFSMSPQVLWVFVQLFALTFSESSFKKDTSLTYSQKVTLDKFKGKVINRLPHDYMKTDLYLIRWLRARNFNIDLAEQMLNENLKWRSENKIDTILDEEFSAFHEKYPYFLDTKSKDGKPIVTGNFGDWPIRDAGLAGRMPQLIRYLHKIMEHAATTVRKVQQQGQNISRYDFLINMDNYNLVQHGCLSCIPFYLGLINSYENYYPLYADHIILINTPPIFELVLQVIRPLMSPPTRDALQVYGQNKSAWRKVLLQIVDEDQLAPEYGGTFKRLT